ncbi:GIY-YIG nuclease family protein [Methylobacterium fujisawaense]
MARLTRKARLRQRKQRVRAQLEAGVLALEAPLADQSVTLWPARSKRHPPGFYVYRLLDPRTGVAFYVGKGQRFRAWHHQRAVAAGRIAGNARKVRAISDILAAGLDVQIEIVGQYALEADALDHEYRLVDAMPTLTNIMPGGLGAAETPAQIERRRRVREARRETALRAARLRDLERRRTELLTASSDPAYREQVNAWIDGFAEQGETVSFKAPAMTTKDSKAALASFRSSKPL